MDKRKLRPDNCGCLCIYVRARVCPGTMKTLCSPAANGSSTKFFILFLYASVHKDGTRMALIVNSQLLCSPSLPSVLWARLCNKSHTTALITYSIEWCCGMRLAWLARLLSPNLGNVINCSPTNLFHFLISHWLYSLMAMYNQCVEQFIMIHMANDIICTLDFRA